MELNKDIETMLRKVLAGLLHEWVYFLPMVQLFYNNRISSRHDSKPFALMFGRELNDFVDYRGRIDQPLDVNHIKRIWTTMNQLIYPTIFKKVEIEQNKAIQDFNMTHVRV